MEIRLDPEIEKIVRELRKKGLIKGKPVFRRKWTAPQIKMRRTDLRQYILAKTDELTGS